MVLAAYVATAFLVAGIHAFFLLHDPHSVFHRASCSIALVVACISIPLHYGIMRTKDAVTPMPGLAVPFTTFTIVYLLLAVIVIFLLRRQQPSDTAINTSLHFFVRGCCWISHVPTLLGL